MPMVEFGYGESINAENPVWSGPASIDVYLDHHRLGRIPFTAVDDSGETMMQAIWDAVMRGDLGPIGGGAG